MVTTKEISSPKPIRETVQDIRDAFDLMGVTDWNWLKTENPPGIEVRYSLPYEAEPHILWCGSQRYLDGCIRAIYMHILQAQRDMLREVQGSFRGVEYLALLTGTTDGDQTARRPGSRKRTEARGRFRNLKDACLVLGIAPDADEADVKIMYDAKAKRFHTDNQDTGDVERFKEITEARAFIYARRGW